MTVLPEQVPNDWDPMAQMTVLTDTVNQLIVYLAEKEDRERKAKK